MGTERSRPSDKLKGMQTLTHEHATGAILLLEDEDDFREMLRIFLQRAGYHVMGFSSAVDALTVLQRGAQVSLILLDLMMPGVSGFQFRTEQRADVALRDIPVVVLTGGQHPRDYHPNLHAVAYLEKPVDLDQVLTIVRQHCGPPPEKTTVM
jgi:CheY-like chemotaxis protein